MVKLHKVISFFYVILSLFLLNRNLAWNKIAIIHPSAFSTLPSLRKLWVFYYLFMAALFIIRGHLSLQCTDCPPSVFPTLELYQTREEPPTPPRPCRPYVHNWRSGWQLFSLLRWNFPFLLSDQEEWNSYQLSSKGLWFYSWPSWLIKNLCLFFSLRPPFPPLTLSSFRLPSLIEKGGIGQTEVKRRRRKIHTQPHCPPHP